MASQYATSMGRVERPDEPPQSLRADVRSVDNLPVRQTSFVGRSMELAELAELLASPECRLLTIIGPGGIGKTRLALEAAEAARETFADGVAFVPLQAVGATESILSAVAAAIGCTLKGPGGARDLVARFLSPKHLLLVIDNFEHLLGEASWLSELLAASPGLRILATSREALNLREEWRYPLAGLATPTEDEAVPPEHFEAVRLFVERAQQTRRDFSLEAESEGVVRLCHITEGLPLALELAAAWTRTLSCQTIADEIERNIAFLSSDLRNIPVRHRSMQAAFDYSWALLTENERRIFQRLAVFRGGFDRAAAEQVAGASLALLSSLVDKSLVRYEADGRFYLHELLRHYAEEHLSAVPEEAAQTQAAHREFYLTFVAARFTGMVGGAQREATDEIGAELDNIRVAWQGAVAAGDIEALGRVAHTLTLYFTFRSRYRDGLAILEEGLRVLRAADPSPLIDRTLAAMLVDTVRLHHPLGQLSAVRAALTESEEIYSRYADPPPPGRRTDPQGWRALLALIDGQYAEADRLSAEVIQRNTANDGSGNLPSAWWIRAAAALWQADIDAAKEYARHSTDAALSIGDRWHLTWGRNMQGHVAVALGDYAEARRHYEAGYALHEELDDPEGMGTGLSHLAKVAALQGDRIEAEHLYRQSLAIARDISDQVTVANALIGLGTLACATGDYAAAGHHFAEGLRRMAETRFMRLLTTLLTSAADWLLQAARPVEAVGALALARAHPASDHETRARASQLLAAAAEVLPPEEYDAAVERVLGVDPAELATRLIPLLTMPLPDGFGQVSPHAAPDQPGTASALVEPLTAREVSVLQMIAAGYSNRDIADKLFLAVNTIRSYNQQIYGKLGVSSRTQAVARARDLGLLS